MLAESGSCFTLAKNKGGIILLYPQAYLAVKNYKSLRLLNITVFFTLKKFWEKILLKFRYQEYLDDSSQAQAIVWPLKACL